MSERPAKRPRTESWEAAGAFLSNQAIKEDGDKVYFGHPLDETLSAALDEAAAAAVAAHPPTSASIETMGKVHQVPLAPSPRYLDSGEGAGGGGAPRAGAGAAAVAPSTFHIGRPGKPQWYVNKTVAKAARRRARRAARKKAAAEKKKRLAAARRGGRRSRKRSRKSRRKRRRSRYRRGFDKELKRVIAQHRRYQIARGDKRFKATKKLVKWSRPNKTKRKNRIYYRKRKKKISRRRRA